MLFPLRRHVICISCPAPRVVSAGLCLDFTISSYCRHRFNRFPATLRTVRVKFAWFWYFILTGRASLKLCRISLAHKISTPVQLLGKETLKFTFQVVDKDSGKGVQPHQTFLRFYDEKTNEEGIQPVRVTPGGKAKFELVRLSFLLTKYNSK